MKTFALFFAIVGSALIPLGNAEAAPSDHHMPLVETVSNTSDSGRGSLREAITRANRNAKTRIVFAISPKYGGLNASNGEWVIAPHTPLPALSKPDTKIECNSPVVVSGEKLGDQSIGLSIKAVRCSVSGLRWVDWSQEAILIRSSRALVRDNSFRRSLAGIVAEGANSNGNRFERNLFQEVHMPIALRAGANGGIARPTLTIARQDTAAQMGHQFTVRFQGQSRQKVSLELDYSPNEARSTPQITAVQDSITLKTDERGVAEWRFNRTGYPVGSWAVVATQNGNSSELSDTAVMPYLR